MNCKALDFSELLTEQKVYLCLLCWGTATTSLTIPIEREAATAQGSANKTALASENANVRLLLCFLRFLYWKGSSGSTDEELESLQSHPSSLVSFLASRTWDVLLDLTAGGFFPVHSCSGLYAQSCFTHLHDCQCPLSLILRSHNVFTVLLIFPGWEGATALVRCQNSSPGPVLWFFSAHSSLSQNLFFPPSCVSVTLLLSAVLLRPLHQWHRLLPVSRLGKICSHASCRQELFSKNSKGIDTEILWTSCFISPQKRGSNGMCKLEENWGSLGSGELHLIHPGCCFRSSLQPMIDSKLLWPGL